MKSHVKGNQKNKRILSLFFFNRIGVQFTVNEGPLFILEKKNKLGTRWKNMREVFPYELSQLSNQANYQAYMFAGTLELLNTYLHLESYWNSLHNMPFSGSSYQSFPLVHLTSFTLLHVTVFKLFLLRHIMQQSVFFLTLPI